MIYTKLVYYQTPTAIWRLVASDGSFTQQNKNLAHVQRTKPEADENILRSVVRCPLKIVENIRNHHALWGVSF